MLAAGTGSSNTDVQHMQRPRNMILAFSCATVQLLQLYQVCSWSSSQGCWTIEAGDGTAPAFVLPVLHST